MATVVGEQQQQQHELLTPQQMMQVASMERAEPETDPIVLRVAAQLSWLASQHHTSDYNQIKYGPKGAAAVYIPLSILLPAHVKELRVYQLFNTQKQAWWFAVRPRIHAVMLRDPAVGDEGAINTQDSAKELQEALSLAMESPLPPLPMHLRQLSRDQTPAPAKTSDSHPINMSPMVPFELLFRLHIYLQHSLNSTHPTYLHLPYELTLDALTAPNQTNPPATSPPPPTSQNSQPNGIPANGVLSAIPPSMVQVDLTEDIPTPPPAPHTSPKLRIDSIDAALIPLPPSPEDQRRPTLPNGDSNPPWEDPNHAVPFGVDAPSYFSQPLSSTLCRDIHEATTSTMDLSTAPQRPAPKYIGRRSPMGVNGVAQPALAQNGAGDADFKNFLKAKALPIAPVSAQPPPRLGNLMLSSCPGKKVRLQGPVKGRGTIYRDLARDLQRIRDSGVGCIVCCLDDSELHFLGAPWEDYSREASQLGIDILRLPTPEGFAPLDAAVLNSHIDLLINQYTIRGISILVHCRGGVGRAGLIACCWMLKMGLCGWIRHIDYPPPEHPYHVFFNNNTLQVSPDPINVDPSSNGATPNGVSPHPSHQNGSFNHMNGTSESMHRTATFPEKRPNGLPHVLGLVRLDTMDMVERVIRVVRRRRSVKAIETFEQVHFLVQFVEYLRTAPTAGPPAV